MQSLQYEVLTVRPPATIADYLSVEEMRQWVQEAPDAEARKRRTAIWLTRIERLHAKDVAQKLGASIQAVWLWIRQYNRGGPDGLIRVGRGGRRGGLMNRQDEEQLLAPFLHQAREGRPPKTTTIRAAIEKHLGKAVSLSYVYRLLGRHGWADLLAQSRHPAVSDPPADTFDTLSRPWQRNA
jgi:transposase